MLGSKKRVLAPLYIAGTYGSSKFAALALVFFFTLSSVRNGLINLGAMYMLSMVSDFRLIHRYVSVAYMQGSIMVKFKKTMHGLSDYSPNVPEPVEEGYETTLPRWLAEWLVENGYAEYTSEGPTLKQQLAKSVWQEEQGTHPQKIPESFYAELKKPIEDMLKSNDPNFATVQSTLQDLLRMRAKKIRRMAESNARAELLDALSPEEKAWFEAYRQLFQDWIDPVWFMYPTGFKIELWLNLNE